MSSLFQTTAANGDSGSHNRDSQSYLHITFDNKGLPTSIVVESALGDQKTLYVYSIRVKVTLIGSADAERPHIDGETPFTNALRG